MTSISGFLEDVRRVLRRQHLSLRTEEVYVHRIREYILFHGRQHPQNLRTPHLEAYLTHLAVERQVAASTQNVARSALLFLYRDVLRVPLPAPENVAPAKRPERLPVVLTREEVRALLAHLDGPPHLMAALLYGSGLRLMECLRLRVKDVDLARSQITVRDGKGGKDRVTMLPRSLAEPLQRQLASGRALYEHDLAAGAARVFLPDALARKYPNASREWAWQWVFPAARPSTDPRTGDARRHHVGEEALQRAVKAAVREAGIAKAASCHTLRPRTGGPGGLLRHPLDRGRLRHTHGAGTIGTRGRADDHDLHPRPQPGRARRPQPPGRDVSGRWRKQKAGAACGAAPALPDTDLRRDGLGGGGVGGEAIPR